jgi:hypothetical protein
MATLTKRVLDAAKPRDKEYFAWCGALRGFGARIYPSGRKIFIAQVRVGRIIQESNATGSERYTFGGHAPPQPSLRSASAM